MRLLRNIRLWWWKLRMRKNSGNRITLRNLERDIEKNRFRNHSTYENFKMRLNHEFTPISSPMRAFRKITGTLTIQGHYLDKGKSLATIIPIDAYVRYVNYIAGFDTCIDDLIYLSRLIHRFFPKEGKELRSGSFKGMRGNVPIWVTEDDMIQPIIERLPHLNAYANGIFDRDADELRNALGLIHMPYYMPGFYVLKISYGYSSGNVSIHNPTCFDAGGSIVWRSCNSGKEWGMTVHLTTHEESLPEAIHEDFEIKPYHKLRAIPVGWITTRIFEADLDISELYDRI